MVQQYPHIMQLMLVATDSTQDANGNWVTADPQESNEDIRCRYETSDGNGYVVTESGAQEYYDAIVYMPLPVDDIPIGASVTINDCGKLKAKGKVKHFNRGFFNARVWL